MYIIEGVKKEEYRRNKESKKARKKERKERKKESNIERDIYIYI